MVDARVAVANSRVATNIGRGRGRVPGVTDGNVSLVERSVEVEVVVGDSNRRGDSETVAIRRYTENKLVGRETSLGPSRNSGSSGTLLTVGGSAIVVEGRVWTSDLAECPKDVIVHDLWCGHECKETTEERATCQPSRERCYKRKRQSKGNHLRHSRERCLQQQKE